MTAKSPPPQGRGPLPKWDEARTNKQTNKQNIPTELSVQFDTLCTSACTYRHTYRSSLQAVGRKMYVPTT